MPSRKAGTPVEVWPPPQGSPSFVGHTPWALHIPSRKAGTRTNDSLNAAVSCSFCVAALFRIKAVMGWVDRDGIDRPDAGLEFRGPGAFQSGRTPCVEPSTQVLGIGVIPTIRVPPRGTA